MITKRKKWGEPYNWPSLLLPAWGTYRRMQCREREPKQSSAISELVQKTVENSERPTYLEFAGQEYCRKLSWMERRDCPPVFWWVLNQCRGVRDLPKTTEKSTWKEQEAQHLALTQGRSSLCSCDPKWGNLMMHKAMGRICKRRKRHSKGWSGPI